MLATLLLPSTSSSRSASLRDVAHSCIESEVHEVVFAHDGTKHSEGVPGISWLEEKELQLAYLPRLTNYKHIKAAQEE